MDIENVIRGHREGANDKSQLPFVSRTLKDLVELGPHMVTGNPGAEDRIIYQQVIGLGGNRRISIERVFPPVTITGEAELEKLGLVRWRTDLTCYNVQDFATGELNRSKGHINNQREIEIFQTITGRIRMLLQDPKDLSKAYYVDAGPDECALVPPGWYHSTHVLEGPSDVINLVNREGFLDWSEKGYGKFQAAFTFIRSASGGIAPVVNSSYPNKPALIVLQPTELPILHEFSGSIFKFVHQAQEELLEEMARDILFANLSSCLVLPQQTKDGVIINDYYQPVYTSFDNLVSRDELHILGLQASAVYDKPMTYLKALWDLPEFRDKDQKLLSVLPERLGDSLAKDSVREWVNLFRHMPLGPNRARLGPDLLWQQGYRISRSFETGGFGSQTFLAIDPNDRLSVVKYSDQEGVDGNGISWLRKQAARTKEYRAYLGEHIPIIFEEADIAESLKSVFFYSMEYRPFETLSDYLLYNQTANELEFFRRLNIALEQQVEYLYDKPDTWIATDRHNEEAYLETFYVDRFRRRLGLLTNPHADLNSDWREGNSSINYVAPIFEKLINADTVMINGIVYPNLPRFLEAFQASRDKVNRFRPRRLGLGHGDFHSGNIGFEFGKSLEEGFIQFDLRGVDRDARMDIVYDMGKLAFSFLFALTDQARALTTSISNLQVNERTKEANICLEFDASQEKRIFTHLEARRHFWDFLKNHQSLVNVFGKMDEASEMWLARTALAEAVNFIGVAPDRLRNDPSGSLSLTYYVLATILLNDFLGTFDTGIGTGLSLALSRRLL